MKPFIKSIFVHIILFPCMVIAQSNFVNHFATLEGYAFKVCELPKGELVVLLRDDADSSKHLLVKLAATGEILAKQEVLLEKGTPKMDVLTLINDTIVLSYSISIQKQGSHYWAQQFQFFSLSLEPLLKNEYRFTDDFPFMHDTWYHVNNDLVWSGFLHRAQQKCALNIFRFNTQGQVVQNKLIDSLSIHGHFCRFFENPNSTKLIAATDGITLYELDQQLNIQKVDTLQVDSTYSRNIRSWPLEIIEDTDGDLIGLGTAESSESNQNTIALLNLVGNTVKLKARADLDKSFFNVVTNESVLASVHKESGTVYVVTEYETTFEESNKRFYLHLFDNQGNFIKTILLKDLYQFGMLTELIVLNDRSCIITGNIDHKIYIVKVNNEGVVSYTLPINNTKATLMLYPNPSTDGVFYTNGATQGIIKVFDIEGKPAYEGNFTDAFIDLSQLPKGMYYAEIKDPETQEKFNRKLVICQ
jgi:hypothetical protein